MKTLRNCIYVAALSLFVLATFSAACAQQQLSPTLQAAIGHWQVIDSDGKLGGQVETYLAGGKLFGKVTKLRPGRLPGDLCTKCSGELRDQLILGMVFLRNFHPEDDVWVGGTVVDPDNGKEYKGKIWAIGNDKLFMRGFVGISLLGRTETWKRIP